MMSPEFRKKLDNLIAVKDNYLDAYDQVLIDSENWEYRKCPFGVYPGIRTKNLYGEHDFSNRFISQVMRDFFPEVTQYDAAFHYHKNLPYEESILNDGWIHSDPNTITGVLYLTPRIIDDTAGTSFYHQVIPDPVALKQLDSRSEFIKDETKVDEYRKDLIIHNSCYDQILNVPFASNRLTVFDSRIPHKPNSYKFKESAAIRKSILFYVQVNSTL